jgi:hypothetical protein
MTSASATASLREGEKKERAGRDEKGRRGSTRETRGRRGEGEGQKRHKEAASHRKI